MISNITKAESRFTIQAKAKLQYTLSCYEVWQHHAMNATINLRASP